MKTLLPILPAFTALLLIGCDSGPNFAKLCEENPEICAEFQEDSWCKKERIDVGLANIAHLKNQQDSQKYQQLIAYESYDKCVTHAVKIEHVKLKEKRTRRIENMMKARDKISTLAEQTARSNHPRLLYFHWTRFLSEPHLEKFLALEGTKALETTESQYDLATYYAKRDQKKTLQLLFKALTLYDNKNEINDDIFKSLSTIFAEKNEFKQAYIWLKVLHLHDPQDRDLSKDTLTRYVAEHKLNAEYLDKVATSTLNHVLEMSFKAPNF